MNPLSSLRRGLLATSLAILLSLAFCLAVSPEFLTGWGTVLLVAMVPAQIVISLVWQSVYPVPLAALPQPQPLRGLAYPLEIWLASALLGVTFPLMVVIGTYFQFWPLAGNSAVDGLETAKIDAVQRDAA